MSAQTWIVLAVVAAALLLLIRKARASRKGRACGCSGGGCR